MDAIPPRTGQRIPATPEESLLDVVPPYQPNLHDGPFSEQAHVGHVTFPSAQVWDDELHLTHIPFLRTIAPGAISVNNNVTNVLYLMIYNK
jgi:hypothetical protein